jgi:hypothetical protein
MSQKCVWLQISGRMHSACTAAAAVLVMAGKKFERYLVLQASS